MGQEGRGEEQRLDREEKWERNNHLEAAGIKIDFADLI